MQQVQHLVNMAGGGRIALYRFKPKNSQGLPIIVAHGTISNGSSMEGLAEHLQEQGFDCWVLEWGGHGDSQAASRNNNFESPAFNDTPAAIEYVLNQTGQSQLNWVSHSGGGHLPLMYLARFPQHQNKLAGIVSIGAQATDGALGLSAKFRALILWSITRVLGHTPKALVSVGTEGEPTLLLAQWSRWNLSKSWKGKGGFDYMQALNDIYTPALIVAGANDDIAPPSGCRKFFDALGAQDKSWLLCATDTGFSKDYSHGQLIRGRAAKAEVYPAVTSWLVEQSQSNAQASS
jgi:oxygen-independent coproporphyrinogen-3 oxidase